MCVSWHIIAARKRKRRAKRRAEETRRSRYVRTLCVSHTTRHACDVYGALGSGRGGDDAYRLGVQGGVSAAGEALAAFNECAEHRDDERPSAFHHRHVRDHVSAFSHVRTW